MTIEERSRGMLRYQEAYLPDRIEPGERDCAERWELIAPYVPDSGIMVDVGSNLGYYGLRAIATKPDLAVVSIESDAAIAERQREIAASHDTDRLCLVLGRVDARLTGAWVRTCDWLDLTLLLSVLHWVDDPVAVLRDLSGMSGRIIAEVPDAADVGACGRSKVRLWGQDPIAWFRSVTGRDVASLGRISRHTSEVPSHLLLVEGPVSRRPDRAYWDAVFPHPESNDYAIAFDGSQVDLSVRGRSVNHIPGINLVSLMKIGRLIYPGTRAFERAGERAIDASTGHGDPFPHNMLWSARGIDLIDADDQETETDRASAIATLHGTLESWESGRTVANNAYIRQLLGPARFLRRRTGMVLRRLLSDQAVEAIKVRFGL
jgi:hypothetical protein